MNSLTRQCIKNTLWGEQQQHCLFLMSFFPSSDLFWAGFKPHLGCTEVWDNISSLSGNSHHKVLTENRCLWGRRKQNQDSGQFPEPPFPLWFPLVQILVSSWAPEVYQFFASALNSGGTSYHPYCSAVLILKWSFSLDACSHSYWTLWVPLETTM